MGNCFGSSSSTFDHPIQNSTNYPTTSSSDLLTTSSSSTAGKSHFYSEPEALGLDEEEKLSAKREEEILDKSTSLREFTFVELKAATKNFKADSLLGEGGFGKVYKGWIDGKSTATATGTTGMVVAIKKLNSESVQGFNEWQSEVNFLGKLSHPNLVKLLGYCWEEKELLLVYEFMPKGSLENHLFRRNPGIEALSWLLRLKIVIGAARGLAFLHTSQKQVIYRDFKASNILLDANFNPKISDFGLAKLGPSGGDTHVSTRVIGTYGYAAPEYVSTGHLYVKSDVYGFGVVLLEMLTGLRALDTKRPKGQLNLVEWLKPILSHKRKVKDIIDARIEGQFSTKAVNQAAQLALKCIESDPKNRPSMREVVEVLEQIEEMDMSRESTTSNSSRSAKHHRHRSPLHSSTPSNHK